MNLLHRVERYSETDPNYSFENSTVESSSIEENEALPRSPTQRTCRVLGTIFVMLGLAGYALPHLFWADLNPTHNLVHLISGALSLWYSGKPTPKCLRFSVAFGVIYGLVGIFGIIGGTVDRLVHIAIAAIFLGAATVEQNRAKRRLSVNP